MAKQNSIIIFTGKLGNMIGYYRKGSYFLRSAPESVRQTAATRQAAQRFGIASRKGALIRSAFDSKLDVHGDGSHINRLNSVLIRAGGKSIQSVIGFQFNQHAGIERFFTVAPVLTPEGTFHIPAQALSTGKDTTSLEVKIIAARVSFGLQQVVNVASAIITIDPKQPFTGISFSVDVPGTGTLMIAVQARGMRHDGPSVNRKDMVADIVGVMEPQEVTYKAVVIHPPHAIADQPSAIFDARWDAVTTRNFIQRE